MTMSTLPVRELDERRACSFAVWKRLIMRDLHREIGEALAEGARVLLGENRRRHQHGDLPPALHRLERGAHRDLGLAVAHVAARAGGPSVAPLHVAL